MASKSAQPEPEKAEVVEAALDDLDDALDRLKVLYEQYFLGIQKQPPQFVHIEVERKLRDLAQMSIRNTALRYRFVTLQQKFGSYNTYWRRTLREIEAGRYIRSLSKITRQAAATGAEIPYEILAAMPRRMREQVRRDREAALAIQRRRRGLRGDAGEDAMDEAELLTLVPLEREGGDGSGGHRDDDEGDGEGFVRESTDVREQALRARGGAHVVDESDAELDLDAFFREVEAAGPATAAAPAQSSSPRLPPIAPSQQARPNPIAPGSSSARPPVSAEVMTGPFPRTAPAATPPRPLPPIPAGPPAAAPPPKPAPTAPPPKPAPTAPSPKPAPTAPPPPAATPRPAATATPPKPPPIVAPPRPTPPLGPPPKPPITAAGPPPPPPPRSPAAAPSPDARPVAPPGMSEPDVNALYAKYARAKEAIGQTPNPGSFNRLMRTLQAQTPKILEQYQAKGVDFTVAIQDNQVIIRAKPKL